MIKIEEIKQRLAEAIKQSGLTQKEIGNKIGVGQSCIAHYIKGDRLPTLDLFANLCVVLDVESNEILGITK